MATGVIYLDVDDEITSAASRIRSVDGRRVAVVVPYGSRVATSRINFRLLARDALTHEKRLSVVAGDAATRALAASAGLPVFESVGEYEASLEATGSSSATAAGIAAASGLAASTTVVSPPDPAVEDVDASVTRPALVDTGSITSGPTAPTRTTPRRPGSDHEIQRTEGTPAPTPVGVPRAVPRAERVTRPEPRGIGRTPVLIGLAVLALAVVVGAVAAYLLLPSATVAITPRQETIGPVPFRVTASTTATEPDAKAGVVPAQILDLGVEAVDTFPATGQRVEEATATGTVRFLNFDFTAKNTIDKGEIVSTGSGVKFRTDKAVTLEAAELVIGKPSIVNPTSVDVSVTAVEAGTAGNVDANTITTVPRGEEPLFLKVNNPDPTGGGTRTEFPRVKQADVDAAVAALTATLGNAFAERLADPALSAGGATVFPETAVQGAPVFNQDLEALVGLEVPSFDLGATTTGAVTVVDAGPVQVIAEARLASEVAAGYLLLDGSSEITVDPAVVDAGAISFPVVVTARQVRILDPAAIKTEIIGLPLADARAILDGYGTVDLVVWPEWVGTIPTIDSRVQVTVDAP